MIRVGILGMGIRGQMYAQGLAENPEATLIAVGDTSPDARNAASAKWGASAFSDFRTLLSEAKPDAVIICTPDRNHCEAALLATAHGAHILIEKPLATSEIEAAQIVEAVQANNVICQVAFENRWNPPFVQIKKSVEKGELGNISLINARLNDTIWVPTQMISWAGNTTVGWFLLPHVLDLAIWLSGKRPTSVYAVANKEILPSMGIDTYDTICSIVSFENGLQAIFENTWVLPESSPAVYDFRFAILGDKGAMHVNSQEQMIHQFTDRFTYPGSLFLDIHGKTRGFPLYMLDSFIDSIKDGKPTLATVEEGYLVTKVVEAVHKSIRSGTPMVL